MPKPTYEYLKAIDEGLFWLTEHDRELRTHEWQNIRKVRGFLQDRKRKLRNSRAASPGKDTDGPITTTNPEPNG